ncbi:protein STRUBBELIG-receptor family 2 [Tanacetum coccineum]|uniref:Protein STRUBBELIG-receptor family 2 n=1 Tax=Tanacetum coccineum TaxID=301880 RepID=A0ABQ4Z5I7_9ASTR
MVVVASEVDRGGIVPEYIQPKFDNQKDDIYAFGVLLLELSTIKKSSYRLNGLPGLFGNFVPMIFVSFASWDINFLRST